ENSAEEMLDRIANESCAEDYRDIACSSNRNLFTGLVTNMIADECGSITRLTVLNQYAHQATFQVLPDTKFYYEDTAAEEVKIGSLITVVHNPCNVSCPSYNGCDDTVKCRRSSGEMCPSADDASENMCVPPREVPLQRWTIAKAVLVHGYRPWLINGAISDVDMAGNIITITFGEEDTQVKIVNDTTFVFLPGLLRMAMMESLEEDEGNKICRTNRPELSDVQIGSKVVAYAPHVKDEGIRVAKIVVVFPCTPLERITGTISAIDEDQKVITVQIDSNDSSDCGCELSFGYTDSTVIVLRGSLGVEMGDNATAWCRSDKEGGLTAVRIAIQYR
ncbi:MAG: hypothetical protein SVY53_10630, partial [Chloroflexota bacterium]|nr:hypothetical protein [Chloroflexota bacterium]